MSWSPVPWGGSEGGGAPGSWGSLTLTQDGEDHPRRHELRACLRSAHLTLVLGVITEVAGFDVQVEFPCGWGPGSGPPVSAQGGPRGWELRVHFLTFSRIPFQAIPGEAWDPGVRAQQEPVFGPLDRTARGTDTAPQLHFGPLHSCHVHRQGPEAPGG